MAACIYCSLFGLLTKLLDCFLEILLGGSCLCSLKHSLESNLDSTGGVSLEHMLHGLGGSSSRSEGMPDGPGDGNLRVSSNSSSSVGSSSVLEDVSNGSQDVVRSSDHGSVSSHHVAVMVSNITFLVKNTPHFVNHLVMMSGSVVNDGMELVDKLVMVDQSVHAAHVKCGL